MRRGIETAPKDGTVVALEDEETGSSELARWSSEARAWVCENGEPSMIAPTHWHPARSVEWLQQQVDELVRQGKGGSSDPSDPSCSWVEPPAAPDVIVPPNYETLQQQFDEILNEILRQKGARLSGRSDPSFSNRIELPATPDVIVPSNHESHQQQSDAIIRQNETGLSGRWDPSASDRVKLATTPEVPVPPASKRSDESLKPFEQILRQKEAGSNGRPDHVSSDRSEPRSPVPAPGVIVPPTYWSPAPLEDQQQFDEIFRQPGTGLSGRSAPSTSPDRVQPPSPAVTPDATARPTNSDERLQQQFDDIRHRLSPTSGAAHRPSFVWKPLSRRRFAVFAIALAMIGASLIGYFYREQVAAYVTQYGGQRDLARNGTAVEQADGSSQVKRTADTATELQQSVHLERARTEALAAELAKAKRELETQAALLSHKDDEAAQLKRRADTATAELQQSLQQQRERAEALAGELTKARREVDAQAAVLGKKDDEAAQLKRTADTRTAELRQSVQQERARAEALTGEPARAKRETASATVARKQDDEAAQLEGSRETIIADLQQAPAAAAG